MPKRYSAIKVIFLKPYQRGDTAAHLPACTEIANADKLVNNSKSFWWIVSIPKFQFYRNVQIYYLQFFAIFFFLEFCIPSYHKTDCF